MYSTKYCTNLFTLECMYVFHVFMFMMVKVPKRKVMVSGLNSTYSIDNNTSSMLTIHFPIKENSRISPWQQHDHCFQNVIHVTLCQSTSVSVSYSLWQSRCFSFSAQRCKFQVRINAIQQQVKMEAHHPCKLLCMTDPGTNVQ